MRVILLALVLANAIFFMWSTWVAVPPVEISPREASGLAGLTLLSELDTVPADNASRTGTIPEARTGPASDAADPGLPSGVSQAPGLTLEVPSQGPAEGSVLVPGKVEVDSNTEQAGVMDAGRADGDMAGQPPTRGEAPLLESSLPPLEAAADTAPAAVAASIQLALADTPTQCASMGPFPDLRQATEVASRLRSNGFEPSQRLAEEQVWVGHWVYLPSYPTRTEAIDVVERLRAAGVRDIYIEPRGDRENAVSLGLFSDRENAELYAGRVRQHDVRPQITDRYRVGTAYWVDIALSAGRRPDPAAYQRDEARRLRLEPRACDAPRVAERDAGN